ncbi:MAG: hypothetical protein ACMUIL_02580 [bacterium]
MAVHSVSRCFVQIVRFIHLPNKTFFTPYRVNGNIRHSVSLILVLHLFDRTA